jgi:hypothetical protein
VTDHPDPPDPTDQIRRQFEAAISGMELDDLKGLAAQLLGVGQRPAAPSPEPRPSRRRPRRGEPVTYRIRVDLDDAHPPIWRRLDVRCDLTLDVVHQVLQAAFGWWDYHLHRFALGAGAWDPSAELFLCPSDVEEGEDCDEHGVPASTVHLDETLSEPGDQLRYCYDYGDSWELTLTLESVHPLDPGAPPAVCVDGRRAAPPEDCGGLRDAADLAEVIDDPARFDLAEVNQALTNPFLLLVETGIDRRLHDLLLRFRGTSFGDDLVTRIHLLAQKSPGSEPGERETALHAYLWFLDHVADQGLALTAAGYLKPVDVTAAAAVVPEGSEWIGAKNREIDTYPVLAFRASLQQLGLLRKYRGRLLLTKAGHAARGNPDRLWQHLAARLPVGKQNDMARPAGLFALVYAASAPDQPVPFETIAQALTDLGWRQGQRDPISALSADRAARDTLDLLHNVPSGPRSRPGPRQLTPVAAALARDAILGRTS